MKMSERREREKPHCIRLALQMPNGTNHRLPILIAIVTSALELLVELDESGML